jgi:hypothetical protein
MKKRILPITLISLITFFNAHAQINKGSIFLGGQISYYNQGASSPQATNQTTKNNQFNISPAIGKAIKDNVVVGFDLSYASAENKTTNYPYDQKTNTYGAGIFMRRYVPLGKGFYVFGQGRVGGSYNTGNIKQGDPVIADDIKGFSATFGFYPGISYQLSKRVHLETGFNNLFYIEYDHSSDKQTNTGVLTEVKTNTFTAGTSFNNIAAFTLGIRVLLSK